MKQKEIKQMITKLTDTLIEYMITEEIIRMDIERYKKMLKHKQEG